MAPAAGPLSRSTSVLEELLGGRAGPLAPPPPLLQQHSLPAGAPLPMSPPPPPGRTRTRPAADAPPARRPAPDPAPAPPPEPASLSELEAFWAAAARAGSAGAGPGAAQEVFGPVRADSLGGDPAAGVAGLAHGAQGAAPDSACSLFPVDLRLISPSPQVGLPSLHNTRMVLPTNNGIAGHRSLQPVRAVEALPGSRQRACVQAH